MPRRERNAFFEPDKNSSEPVIKISCDIIDSECMDIQEPVWNITFGTSLQLAQETHENMLLILKELKVNQEVYWADTENGHIIWKKVSVKKRLGKHVWLLTTAEGKKFKKHADQIRAIDLQKGSST